jgi:hypothetical protein
MDSYVVGVQCIETPLQRRESSRGEENEDPNRSKESLKRK